MIASTWQRHALAWQDALSPGAIEAFVHDLHCVIYRSFRGVQSTTLWIVLLLGDEARVVCCGGPRWFQVGRDGAAETLRTRPCDMPGAHGRAIPVEVRAVDTAFEDVLLAVTDGVIDGVKARSRFVTLAAKRWAQAASTPDWFERLSALAVEAGLEDAQDDDITLLSVKRVATESAVKAG